MRKHKTNIESVQKGYKEFIRNNKSILKIQQRFKSKKHNEETIRLHKVQMMIKERKQLIR